MKHFIFSVLLIFCSAVSANEGTFIAQKADFIINVGSKIYYPQSADNESYKIGVLGRKKMNKLLFEELKRRGLELTIQGKVIEVFLFRSMRQVNPVDLIYVSGEEKIRITELDEKLGSHPYIMVTENFPFGMSSLNFEINVNEKLFFEIQESPLRNKGVRIDAELLTDPRRIKDEQVWQKKLELAADIIRNQDSVITKKEQDLTKTEKEIEKQQVTIGYQYNVIVLSVVFVLVTLVLLLLLLKVNTMRKDTVILLRKKNKQILDSIKYAQRIQLAMLPSDRLVTEIFFESFVLYHPKDIVAGDFYWIEKHNEKVYVSVADCTGHGVPGAILSVVCSKLLTKAVKELKVEQPAKILDQTVVLLQERFSKSDETVQDGMDLSLCCFDFEQMKLEYAGANNPLFLIRDGKLTVVKPDKQPIGEYVNRKPYTNNKLDLKVGDCCYMFTDGYADQFGGEKNKKFKILRLKKLLLENHEKPMQQQKEILEKTINSWKGDVEQVDDICIMGIRVHPSNGK